ncbi:MAG: TetR/AcrR family transcriptional regulator [bacterium]|nr:TetR/AcrR family transcriptional regulator [bacterium]
MGRPKAFDRDEVLLKAVETFWDKGYERTSVQDLVDQMGIHRASLYDTYGSKQELFNEVLERYSKLTQEIIYGPLRSPGPPRKILEAWFESLARDLCHSYSQGCLMIKSILALEVKDHPEMLPLVRKHTADVEAMFLDLLERAKALGEIGTDRDLTAIASYLRHHLYGLIVTAAIRREEEHLMDMVRLALTALD